MSNLFEIDGEGNDGGYDNVNDDDRLNNDDDKSN